MAAKVQLDIESKANTQALKQAIADLEKLGMAGKSTNQVFKQTSNLEGYRAALVKSYETARTFGDQMKATRTAFSDTNKAIKAAQAYLGENKNNMFTFIDEKGMQQQTRDMALIEKQIRGFLGNVVADTQNFQQSMTRMLGEYKGFDNYKEGIERTAQAYRDMGNDLGAVQYKMTSIQQQVLDMTAAQADPAEIQKLTDEYKKLAVQHKELSEAANGSGARIKNLIKNFVSAQLIVWAIRKAFQMLTQGLKEASTAAAEAEQVFGRFDAVFEGLERANAAVSEMVDNFGVAKSSAADILASIGNTALGFGASAMEAAQFSETVAKSLSDIMAFRDVQGTISDFAQRFMSGASGNVENFRAIGSIVRQSMVDIELQKQGWENLTGQALEWAKVQARVNIVLEQQKKAMGATEREWDTLLSIQRRNNEQTKQMKENVGETINQFFKPMSLWILTLKENWNAAHEANKKYNEGVYDPAKDEDYGDTITARVLEKRIKSYTGLYGNAIPNMFMHQLKSSVANYTPWGSDKMGVLKVEDDPNLRNSKASYEQIQLLAEQYQATLAYTATLVEKYGFNVSDSVWEQIDAYDAYIKKINDARKAENARLAASQAEYEGIRDFFADVGSMMGMGGSGSIYDVRDYVKKDAADFVSPLERLLGFEGGEGAELEAKIKGLSNMVESLFNTSIAGSTEYIRTQASEMLTVVASALGEAQKAKAAMESATNYNKAKSSIEDELATMQKRNELEAQYGKDNSEIVNIKIEQWKAEKNAFELFKERLSATGKGKESYQEYLDLMELISKQYGLQLGLAEDIAKAAKDAAAEQARTSASDMFISASRELSYLGENGDGLRQQDEMNDKVAEYSKHLLDSGESMETVIEKATEYRAVLEAINKTNADADADKKAKDAEKAAQSLVNAYQSQLKGLREGIALAEYRNGLEGKYDKQTLDLMVQRKQQEMEALSFMYQQIDAGMKREDAESYYLEQLQLIAKQHGINLGLLEEQVQAAKDLAVEQAQASASDMFVSAQRELSYLGGNGDQLKRQDDINDKVSKYVDYLSKTNMTITEVINNSAKYRDLLNEIYRITDDKKATDLADSLLKSYQERNASLKEELGLMAYRASLTGQYADDEQGIVDLMVQRRKQEAEAFAFMEKQKAAGMDAALALNGYIDNLILIRQIHDTNLKLLQDQIAAARELAVQQAGEGASGMFSAAQRELSYLGPNGDALQQQDEMNDKVSEYIEYLAKTDMSITDIIAKSKEYRDLLEQIAELEGKKKDDAEDEEAIKKAQSLTDAYQSQLQSLKDNISLMEYRSSIEGQNEKEIIDLMVQRKQQEMEAASFKQQQIKAGMDAVEAEGFYQDQLVLIAKQHGLNLALIEAQLKATKGLAIEQARTSASDMFTAATRELSYLGKGGDALKAQDDLNDKVEQYIANLSKTDAGIQEVIDKAKVYRTLLEQIAALEGDNAAAKTAEDFTKSYQDRVDTLRQSYESLKLSSDLEKQYGSERASVEQKHVEALQEAWRYMSEQVKLGMDATEANEMYLDSAKAITAEYELQLGLLEEQSKVKRSEALQEASKAIAGVVGQRALVGASDAQKTQARIDEQVYAFAESLTQGGAKLKETLDQTAEYRRQLEMLAAEEARQAVWDGIKSQWEGLGDVGMISGWVEAFASGGTMAGIAKVATDLLTSFESVNELLSIVTKFIDYVAPAIDQFLAPLMPVLEMIVSTIADLLLPVLQILFPIIQGLSIVLIYLHAVVKTVTNAFSWLVDTIVTAIWNIAHPFRQRAFRDLGDETVAIWEDANAKVEKIWDMELDTRLEFVGKLTDAQQGQLDAYNEMFKAGLLTLTQYNAMVGKNVYGKNFDNVDIASFASGGNFITNGEQIIRVGEAGREHVQITPLNSTGYANRNVQQVGGNSYSVVVNGANGDPEEIAMAVRQEFKRMERRGVRYA